MKFELEKAIEILTRTPGTVRSLLEDLPDDLTQRKDGAENWSPFDIIGHLIHGEETDWIPRARIILSDVADKSFEPFDRFAQYEISKGKTMGELLDQFAELRSRNIETLISWELTFEQLDLTGVHPELGKVDLRQLLATWAVHDLNHIKQIVTVLARYYVNDVGSWKDYLAILE